MAQATSNSPPRAYAGMRWVYIVIAIALVAVTAFTYERWLPAVRTLAGLGQETGGPNPSDGSPVKPAHDGGHDHAGHDHAGHDAANSLELSLQARKNIGLQVATAELTSFTRTISIPGIVVERPGRSVIQVSAAMTGIVTRIYPTEGEAVEPGQKLFELRLTHEELVQAQADLLRTVEELDVLAREVERIEKLTSDGALAGKTLLDRKYEQQRQKGIQRAQRQALFLHGLSEEQVDAIVQERRLLPSITIVAPTPDGLVAQTGKTPLLQVQSLKVSRGESVTAGDTLAMLVDHEQLFIQGSAFERDAAAINSAVEEGVSVSATLATGNEAKTINDLRILYSATNIDPESRTLKFFVTLPNETERNTQLDDGRRFVAWKYRPGQRMEIRVPVETWKERIVVPAAAVAQDGVETYVFTPNGDHLDRRSVHVEYRDDRFVVIANDGAVFPGDQIAISAAQQLQLALKNKAGGGIDPHAGHNH